MGEAMLKGRLGRRTALKALGSVGGGMLLGGYPFLLPGIRPFTLANPDQRCGYP